MLGAIFVTWSSIASKKKVRQTFQINDYYKVANDFKQHLHVLFLYDFLIIQLFKVNGKPKVKGSKECKRMSTIENSPNGIKFSANVFT